MGGGGGGGGGGMGERKNTPDERGDAENENGAKTCTDDDTPVHLGCDPTHPTPTPTPPPTPTPEERFPARAGGEQSEREAVGGDVGEHLQKRNE